MTFDNESRISSLIAKSVRGELSPEEQRELDQWRSAAPENEQLFRALTDERLLKAKLRRLDAVDESAIWQKLTARMPAQHVVTPLWKRLGAAVAALLLIGGMAGYLLFRTSDNGSRLIASATADIEPGGSGATLLLSDGRSIPLSDKGAHGVMGQLGLKIDTAHGGLLLYDSAAVTKAVWSTPIYHTLITDNGETYRVRLPDGSQVTLNAASRLTYAVPFTQYGRRSVELRGEAYFQVAKDGSHPFIVKTSGQQVQVLGTEFNLTAYEDEREIKTTLVEGSLRVTEVDARNADGGTSPGVVIKPEQQAVSSPGTGITVRTVDLETAIGWKNGDFVFHGDDIHTVLRQVARWYDVEFIYHDDIPDDLHIGGYVSRSRRISAVLERLQQTGGVKFRIQGRKIIVTSGRK